MRRRLPSLKSSSTTRIGYRSASLGDPRIILLYCTCTQSFHAWVSECLFDLPLLLFVHLIFSYRLQTLDSSMAKFVWAFCWALYFGRQQINAKGPQHRNQQISEQPSWLSAISFWYCAIRASLRR